MQLTDKEIIEKLKIKKTDRVLDIGGSMDQHRQIIVDTLVDLIRPEEAPYKKSKLRAKNFVRADITKERLPFGDMEFDVCLCTHTLEDLYNPFLVLSEIKRVAKRGVIVTPSRGRDMCFSKINFTDWLTGARRVPGEGHHKWFFEKKSGNTIRVIPKVYPFLYTSEFFITEWTGETEMVFYWNKGYKIEEVGMLNAHALIDEYVDFVKKHKKYITKGPVLVYLDKPLNYVWAIAKLLFKRGKGYEYRKTN